MSDLIHVTLTNGLQKKFFGPIDWVAKKIHQYEWVSAVSSEREIKEAIKQASSNGKATISIIKPTTL